MAGRHSKKPAEADPEVNSAKDTKKNQKRKRDEDESTADTSKSAGTKKMKNAETPSSKPATSQKKSKQSDDAPGESGTSKAASGKKSSSKESSNLTDGDDQTKKRSKTKRKASEMDSDVAGAGDHASKGENASREPTASLKLKFKNPAARPADQDSSKTDKFAGVMSKFSQSMKANEATKEKAKEEAQEQKKTDAAEPVVAHGLEPLPQPEPAPEQTEKPTYSSLPEWLANPVRVSADKKAKFSDLGIDADLLRTLENNGYKDAFAVQSTVLPLLLDGQTKHTGDLCVSAATGSGKTLSYVLPLVKSLERDQAPRLRGLIVVPTRELVKQARETCELLAAGSGLQIGSAVGNVAIKDEQNILMRHDAVFAPKAYYHMQHKKPTAKDWTNFSLRETVAEVQSHGELRPGYVAMSEPNVDILICTPGRLVDHIRSTKGFTLKHLQWLVVDEADRLLNESFQEWVDNVTHSLDQRHETSDFGGQYLSSLGVPMESPEPKKVILSATMTRDITKLNSLRLNNPKMVIISSENVSTDESGIVVTADDEYTLPSTLKEYSVPVGDGAEKPLYLLRLLLSHINASAKTTASDNKIADDETTADDFDASSDTSSDTSDSDSLIFTSSDSESSSEDSSDSNTTSNDSDTTTKSTSTSSTVLVFTKSSESASRLSRLISILDPSLSDRVGTIIKSSNSSASRKTLAAYRQGKISIIIATDRASRGLDLRSLAHVVNYDVPASLTSYVHRVGRTARAGEQGSAWTLVAHREGRWFNNEIVKNEDGKIIRPSNVQKINMKLDGMDDTKSKYGAALEMLEKEVQTGGKSKANKA